MDLGIKGKRAIVTGGGSGIGYETARLFLEEGARVLICGRNAEKLNKARDELAKKTGGEIYAVQADMTNEADIKRMVDTAKEKLGGVDILVNNAGTMYSVLFKQLAAYEMKNQLDTKLFQIDLKDSANAFIGSDTTPMALTVVYNVLPALDIQAAVATDLSNEPGDSLSLLVGARYYAGKL